MTDKVEHYLTEDGSLRGVVCTCGQLATEACRRHDAGPLAAAALSRALSGGALFAALLKGEQSVTLRFSGDGPLGRVVVEAGHEGWLRGCVANPRATIDAAPSGREATDVRLGIGASGVLTVTRKSGGHHLYSGSVPLRTGEIGDELASYFTQSEQTPTTIALATHLDPHGKLQSCGGFLVQALPGAQEQPLARLEQNIERLPPLARLLLKNSSPDEIAALLFTTLGHRRTDSVQLRYQCSCSRAKMAAALRTLGMAELRRLTAGADGADVRCEFCRHRYRFGRAELLDLISADPSTPR